MIINSHIADYSKGMILDEIENSKNSLAKISKDLEKYPNDYELLNKLGELENKIQVLKIYLIGLESLGLEKGCYFDIEK